MQWIKDFFARLRKKFSGNVTLQDEIDRLESIFVDAIRDTRVAREAEAKAESDEKAKPEKGNKKPTTDEGDGVKYSYYSGSKTFENIFDTPQNFLPDSEQEWSTFNRQFANKTNGLKKNQKRNIIIYTANYAYFVSASGYMRGKIVAKIDIDGNEERINSISKEFKDGTFEIGEGTNLLAQSIRGDRGRGYRHHASLKETLAAEGDEGLDGKEYSGDRGRNNRKSNKTAKNVKLSLSDSDSAYLEAVERGDTETAQRFVDEAAAKAESDEKAKPEKGNKKPTTDEDDGVKYSINEDFYSDFDAWDGKDTNKVFTLGTTSEALKSINIKNQEIKMRSGMVLQKLSKHPEMSRSIFRSIPDLLEKPIIVQFSDAIDPNTGKPKYDSRITVLGELYADMVVDGKTVQKPVLVSLELLPTNQKKTKILDVSFVTSAYGHSKLQSYLNENSILYIEPNKKRTNKWLSLNRLQLPLGENRTGPIRKITYSDGKVKVQNSTKKTEMQLALEKAGVINSYGNSIFNDTKNDTSDNESLSLPETDVDGEAEQGYNENKNNAKGDVLNVSENSRVLEGRQISATGRGENTLRQQGENSRKLSSLLGGNKNNGAKSSEFISAGESGFLSIYQGHSGKHDTKTGQDSRGFWESHVRNLPKIKLQPVDSAGRMLSGELQKTLFNTSFKDDNGIIISFYH